MNIFNSPNFDAECRQRYGEKTCIIYQIDPPQYQIKMLDSNCTKTDQVVDKNSFYTLIPQMLVQDYTVVIVEQLGNSSVREITTVHLPKQVQLSNPPIIQ